MDDRVVMESTGSVWTNLYNHLDSKHIPVVLANPLKTKAIAWARIKSDEIDARILAHLLRSDLIAESYVPPQELREIRALIRHRLSIVKIRTMVKNKVHALIDKNGIETELPNIFSKKAGMQWLRSLQFQSSLDRLMLDNYLEHLDSLQRQIKTVDQEILSKASQDQDVKLLLSLTGVSIYTALLLKSEIGDIKRFPNYKKLVSWAGLAPSMHQSGSVEYYGSITKQGSKMIRWIMVESARVAVNHDERLSAFYERIKHRRGDQKAIVATASKMLKIIWTMLSRREAYESRNEKSYERKLNSIDE
ncbi:MAG: IS110 family RNA-guided transposase, partial [Nitrososphaerales archaeon]